jgi:hypothetical protein
MTFPRIDLSPTPHSAKHAGGGKKSFLWLEPAAWSTFQFFRNVPSATSEQVDHFAAESAVGLHRDTQKAS